MRNYEILADRPDNEQAIRLTAQGFGVEEDEVFRDEALGVLDGCHGFVCAQLGDKLLGFLGYKVIDIPSGNLLYISTTMVDASSQKQGISSSLISESSGLTSADYIGFRTQSARMYSVAKNLFSSIQPDIELSHPEFDDLWEVGHELAEVRGTDFPVEKGAYGTGPIYSARQVHPGYPTFYNYINFQAGDALLCVGKL